MESCSTTARLEDDRKAFGRKWHGIYRDELVRVLEGPRETRDQVMEDHQHFHACELVARTHPRAPSERDECERSRTGPFEARWIELVGFSEILWVAMSRVRRPHYLSPQRTDPPVYGVQMLVWDYEILRTNPSDVLIDPTDLIIWCCWSLSWDWYLGFTFHDLGILNPLKLISWGATLNDACTGGISLIDSCTTLHDSFIFWRSPHFNGSSAALLSAISLFSEHMIRNDGRV